MMAVTFALAPAAAVASGPAVVLDVGSLDGFNGFALKGIDPADGTGWSVGRAGDVNGDGVDDVIIGARFGDRDEDGDAGEAYVVFGRREGFASPLALGSLDGRIGFVLKGIDGEDYAGHAVAGAGDVNGDGCDDIMVGAVSADPDGRETAGEAYLVFGSRAGFPREIDLGALDGSNGVLVKGLYPDGDLGGSVAGGGDVNRDGFSDIIISAAHSTPASGMLESGEVFVVFGHPGSWPAALDLTALNGFDGFAFRGAHPVDHLGYAVSSAGDVNGDGVDDILIGAFAASPEGRPFAGESYVVFGSQAGFPAVFGPASLDGTNGFIMRGANPGDLTGGALSGVGDVNGDGVDDFVVSAPFASPDGKMYAGQVYVVFGTRSRCSAPYDVQGHSAECSRPFPPVLELGAIDGTNGLVLKGAAAGDLTGSVGRVGDVDGDGVDDLVIGATGAQPGAKAYVVFGRGVAHGPRGQGSGRHCRPAPEDELPRGFPAVMELGTLNRGEGFVITGMNTGEVPGLLEYGSFVSGAGDANGDGIEDILLGSKLASPDGKTAAGEAWVFYGACGLGAR
jgi:glycosylphosphatidylinositol phospholipase D